MSLAARFVLHPGEGFPFMKIIRLTQGKRTMVSDADFEWLIQWRWYAVRVKNLNGEQWCAVRSKQNRLLYMHREIAARSGLPRSRRYDHRDRDGLNNQRANIRPCTNSQNMANTAKRSGATSQFKGVHWRRDCSKWQAQIRVRYRLIHLGYFGDEYAAHHAYTAAAQKHFGPFANS